MTLEQYPQYYIAVNGKSRVVSKEEYDAWRIRKKWPDAPAMGEGKTYYITENGTSRAVNYEEYSAWANSRP